MTPGGCVATADSLPTWRSGQAVNAWREISGSAPSVLGRTNHSGDNNGNWIDPWCGLSIDKRTGKVWSPANGGHLDYVGNEVNMLDLMLNSPVWVNKIAQSASCATVVSDTNNSAYYADGFPASAHTYSQQMFIEARDRACRFGAGAVSTSGNGSVKGASYKILTNTWDAEGAFLPNLPSSPNIGLGPIVKISDLRTGSEVGSEDVYLFNDNTAVYKWTQATNTMSTLVLNNGAGGFPPSSGFGAGNPVAYDVVRSRIMLLNGASGSYYFTPADNTFTSFTPTGNVTECASSVGYGYDPILDKFIFKPGYTVAGTTAPKTYVMDPSTWVISELTTTGSSGMPMPAAVSGNPANVFTKFLHVPALGGWIYVPNYSTNAWFLRTS